MLLTSFGVCDSLPKMLHIRLTNVQLHVKLIMCATSEKHMFQLHVGLTNMQLGAKNVQLCMGINNMQLGPHKVLHLHKNKIVTRGLKICE